MRDVTRAVDTAMAKTMIHPTAQVAAGAELGSGVRIGPYAIVEDDVQIGSNSVVEGHAVIHRFVAMGNGNRVHPHSVIGGLPQDIRFDAKQTTFVSIGDGNVFREGVTVNRATRSNGVTRIGSGCYFMNNSHVAHDCQVGDETIFANNVAIGGHTAVGDKVFLGGGAMVHQFCRIGSLVMVAGTIGVLQDLIPYTTVFETPARHYRLNAVGLKRAGITGERYRVLSRAFRRLKARQSVEDLPETPELVHLKRWLAAESKRGISAFVGTKKTLGEGA